MEESKVLQTWFKKGEERGEERGEKRGLRKGLAQAARGNLLAVIKAKSSGSAIPKEIADKIEATQEFEILNRWFEAALAATNWDEVLAVFRTTAPDEAVN
jgi:hypothetical protein